MTQPSIKIRRSVHDDLTEATEALLDAWVEEDAEQFTLALEDEGWVLCFPEPQR